MTLAESDKYEMVEGNVYFPDETVKREFFRRKPTTSSCTWKGQARYYTVVVDGQENPDAAWYYPDPKPGARNVKYHVAFWRGVEVTTDKTEKVVERRFLSADWIIDRIKAGQWLAFFVLRA